MTPVMIALLLTVCSLPVQGGIAGMSLNVAKFLSIANGCYDNSAQFNVDTKAHQFIQLRTIPVTTLALPGKTALYIEWAYSGKVLIMELCDVSDINGVVKLNLYNFTDPSRYKPGEYKMENLAKLKPEDLNSPYGCKADLEPIGPATFAGTWDTCNHFVNGRPAMYVPIATCDALRSIIPRAATEESSPIPYNLFLKGDKVKVPGTPAGFVSPCSQKYI